ncbi:unnamed protein product [Phytophthora lilii]|uniref:Unnamed protein product n=1 Tax=Phytophthora lilii TaxID=2077276 RepID=A0A9W6WEG3_9STRA|nr:unnamed protein product [Phytophthora lilii]
MDKDERDDENIPQETAEGTGGKNEKEEVDGEEARVKKLLALECCPKRCLQSQPELVEAVVASLAHMSTKEKKISLLTALAVSSIMKEAKGLDGRERIRFAYCLPLLGEVCRPAFAACYDVSGATLARYVVKVDRC